MVAACQELRLVISGWSGVHVAWWIHTTLLTAHNLACGANLLDCIKLPPPRLNTLMSVSGCSLSSSNCHGKTQIIECSTGVCQVWMHLPWCSDGIMRFFKRRNPTFCHWTNARHLTPLAAFSAQVPKMLGLITKAWLPQAMCISFKLETDAAMLIPKVSRVTKVA